MTARPTANTNANGAAGNKNDPTGGNSGSAQQQQAGKELSTLVSGAFDRVKPKRFEEAPVLDFELEALSAEHDIYKGRLFTEEQCEQITRMAEYHAYRGIGTGWTNEIYTLTAQHMRCGEVPGLLTSTKHIFEQLLRRDLYDLFPGRIKRGSIRYENSNEPHLVRYNGKVRGTELHTDNSEFVYITVNVLLSADDDYLGGGTYIPAIGRTIRLKQGEMLIHLGDLEHAGADLISGVRSILIGFLACDWEDEALNEEKTENARDYVAQ